jgi:uroporphyrinogen decarboxylase
MNEQQWEALLAVLRGERLRPVPTGFIIDSPWLPGWAGHTILDYYTSEKVWLDANLKALTTFPDTLFLPGFWSEFGMCTEPSAFGAVSAWDEDEFPFAQRIFRSITEADQLERPDPRRKGLLPFIVKRLQHCQSEIEQAGHQIRFAVARGPLNIASFLMGMTELLTALKTDPDRTHQLLAVVTDFLVDWIAYQRERFPSIDGILLLDDIVGFVSGRDFQTFGLPYLKRAFDADVSVKFFHNDAPCKACAPYLEQAGINLLNFGVQHTISEMRSWTGGKISLLGNIPPRDVLAEGSAEDVSRAVRDMLEAAADWSQLIVSCGGGMPPGAPTANIQALIQTTQRVTDS